MTRRQVLGAGAAGLAGLAVGTLGLDRLAKPAESATRGDPAINVLLFAGPYATIAQRMLPGFEKASGIHVNLDIMGGEAINQKTSVELLSGSTKYDVISVIGTDVPFYASRNVLQPLDAYLADPKLTPASFDLKDIAPLGLKYYSWSGKQVGLPWIVDTYVLYYRKDLLRKAGIGTPPATPAQYAEAARKLTGGGVYGTTLAMRRTHNLTSEFYEWLRIFGGDLVANDGRGAVVADSPQALRALKFYLGLKRYASPDVLNWAFEQVTTSLAQGTSAMGVQWASVASVMDDSTQSKVVGKMGFALLPKGADRAAEVGGWGLTMPNVSAHKTQAFAFVEWLASKDVQAQYAAFGGGPIRYSVYRDAKLVAKYPWFTAQLASLDHLVFRTRVPQWPRIDDAVSSEVSQAAAGTKSPEAALRDLAAKLHAIMGR